MSTGVGKDVGNKDTGLDMALNICVCACVYVCESCEWSIGLDWVGFVQIGLFGLNFSLLTEKGKVRRRRINNTNRQQNKARKLSDSDQRQAE